MKNHFPFSHVSFLLLFSLLPLSFLFGQKKLSRIEVNQKVIEHLLQTNKTFSWEDASDQMLWSALTLSDSIASIGFQPLNENNLRDHIHEIDLQSTAWKTVRKKIIDLIFKETKKKYGKAFSKKHLLPFGEQPDIPAISIRVFDLEIVKAIRQLPELRYFDAMGYSLEENNLEKSGEGCNEGSTNININDYITITPQSRQSWHQNEHNIDQAWTNSNKGEGIGIAVIDSGVSDTQDKMGSEFDEGDSSGRTIEKYGYYADSAGGPYDGWDDECGHGTSMSSLATAPRGFDNTPAGVAYRANLVSLRGTNDVIIGSSTEKTGVYLSLVHAGDDPNINIVSMSLGDIFSSGLVEDGVIYANNLGTLIFAAAGTSTFLTNWYGVIFPANMYETIAVTGITDATSRTECDVCHYGSEVDFVVTMQRDSDSGRNSISLNRPDNEQGYISGSSAATATMAGIAALVWGNHPTWDAGQVLNRLIVSADYYPNRDDDFGWGKVDALQAVDNSQNNICSPTLSNDITFEITNISFPADDDGFGSENEWVINIGGASHYFDVPENGASGNPANFIDLNVCGYIPIILTGTTNCGGTFLDLSISSHENDSFSANCSFDSGDDYYSSETIPLNVINGTTFTHTSPAGNFVFTYTTYCTPTASPAVSIGGGMTACQNSAPLDITFFGAGGTPPYTIIYNVNNGPNQTISTGVNNTATITQATDILGIYTYNLVEVSDVNGCSQIQIGSTMVEIIEGPNASIAGGGNICPEENIDITFSGTPNATVTYNDGLADQNILLDATGNASINISTEVTFTLISVDDDFCSSDITGSVSVLIDPLPTASISGGGFICKGEIIDVIFSGTPNATLIYDDGMGDQTIILDPNGMATINVSPLISTIYNLVSISDENCSDDLTGSVTVTINEIPMATINGGGSICPEGAIDINFIGTPNATVIYDDGIGNQTIILDPNGIAMINVSPLNSTTYNLISVSDENCNNNLTGSVTVTVNENPTATISGGGSICPNGAIDINFIGTPNATVIFSDGNTVQTIILDANGIAILNVSPFNTTTYSLISISDENCSNNLTDSVTVTVNENPTATISGGGSICPSGAIDINFIGTPNATITFNDGNTNQTIILDANGIAILNVSPLNTTTYFLILVTDDLCETPITGAVSVLVLLPNDPACYSCPPDYMLGGNGQLTGTINSIEHYEAAGTIQSIQIIGPNADVDYDSGTEVELKVGFETVLGAELNIYIDGCEEN